MGNVTPEPIMRIALGFMAAKLLFVASEIGLFEKLTGKPPTLDELAQSTGVPRRTVRIVADAMASLGLLEKQDGGYRNSVHGFDRGGRLGDAVARNSAMVVEHLGCVTGYATEVGYFGHAVSESNEDLKALIGAAPAFTGPGFLLPSRNDAVFRFCLDHGLRLVKQQTLMTIGLYNEPAGAYLPSILH